MSEVHRPGGLAAQIGLPDGQPCEVEPTQVGTQVDQQVEHVPRRVARCQVWARTQRIRQRAQLQKRIPHHGIVALEYPAAADREQGVSGKHRLLAIEHVVSGEVHDRSAERDDVARAARVDGERPLLVRLGAVDVRPGRSVQDGVETRERRGRPAHVPGRLVERDDLLVAKRLGERPPELSAGARYEQAAASRGERIGELVLQRCLTRGSAQQTPCSSGSSGSYSSVTW